MSHLEILDSELQAFQISLPLDQRQLLVRYCDELERWNRKINLTGLGGRELVRRLVVEPVWVGMQLEMSGRLADIGSGNGSPAIPLHIIRRFSCCALIEARAKRSVFLRHVTGILKLPDVRVHRARFEAVTEEIGPVEWITLQAVALTEQLIDSMRSIATPTTTIVWLTSGAEPPVPPVRHLKIPITGTEVLLFRLDQS